MGKRSFDLVVGLVLSVATAPLVLLLALIAAVELRAWPLFTQQRIGRGGRPFTIVKLRTLPPAVPLELDKYALREIPIPPIAKAMRRLHLDELPQLWLVVSGKMSLVGPRPEMPSLAAKIPAAAAQVRQTVRPGCTGLWQVSVAAGGLIHENAGYDVVYVTERSFAFDMWIVWRTILVLLGRPRSVKLSSAVAPRPSSEVGLSTS